MQDMESIIFYQNHIQNKKEIHIINIDPIMYTNMNVMGSNAQYEYR